jgi:hypothetical protein
MSRTSNQGSASVDYEYWSKMAYWKLDEAIALAFGITPEDFSMEEASLYAQESLRADEIVRVHNLAQRAKDWQQLSDPVSPESFLAWAKRKEINIPPELVRLVDVRSSSVMDWKDHYEKLLQKHETLEKQYKQLYERHEQLKAANDHAQSLIESDYWQKFSNMALQMLKEYPAWREKQRIVQKSSNLNSWLIKTLGANSREAEILKRVLSDLFKELK